MYYYIIDSNKIDKFPIGFNEGHNDNANEGKGYIIADKANIVRWIGFGDLIAEVEVPVESPIIKISVPGSYVTQAIIIHTIQPIKNMPEWKDVEFCFQAVHQDYDALRYVAVQTYELCLAAVKHSSLALKNVINQTDEICRIALNSGYNVICYVKNQTEPLCKLAMDKNYFALRYINEQTDSMCRAAIIADPANILYVKNQTDELCMLAIELNPRTIPAIKNQTAEMCLKAVRHDGMLLEYCNIRNPIIIAAALAQNPDASIHV